MIGADGALAAAADAGAAVVSEVESGRPVGHPARAAVGHAAAVDGRRVRAADDRPAAVDGRRRRAGRRLRLAEVCGAHRPGSARARGRSIGIDEVATAVANANSNLPTGTIYGDKTFVVQTNGQLMRAAGVRPDDRRLPQRQPRAPRRGRARLRRRRERQVAPRWQKGERCVVDLDPQAARHQRRRGGGSRSRRCCRRSASSCPRP